MLKFKKILPIVCATAVIFAGCGSDAPAADNSAGAEPGSVVEENIDEPLSADEDITGEEEQQAEGQEAEAAEEQAAAESENSAKASGSESKTETSKSASAKTETKSAAKTETKTSSKSDTSKPAASTNTASSGSTSSSAAPAAAKPAEPTYKYKDGTYSGSAQGFNGPVGVSVTISKDKITAVSVTSSTDDEPYISNAKALKRHKGRCKCCACKGKELSNYSLPAGRGYCIIT